MVAMIIRYSKVPKEAVCAVQDCDMLGLEGEAEPATLWHGVGTVSLGR